jgi:uncharacterized protein YgiM (DUF1202 family)
MSNIKKGMEVGIGFGLGYVTFRIFWWIGKVIAISVLSVSVVASVLSYVASNPRNADIALQKIENATGVATVSSTVAFPKGCTIRSRPSRRSSKIGRAKPGQKLIIVGRHGNWKHVKTSKGTGWVGCRKAIETE